MKLKICGMKHNTLEVASLKPDYLGFIFFEKSPRNFEGNIGDISEKIKRVGVFVNATIETISEKTKQYNLEVIQLHGEESADFCYRLKKALSTEIWKAFGIGDRFNFEELKQYEEYIDKFLFDTKGENKGGNGYPFNWNILKDYPSQKPFILSGGIGLESIDQLEKIIQTKLPIYAIDINSQVETSPGHKNLDEIKKFIHQLDEFQR